MDNSDGDKIKRNLPTKLDVLKDVQQISYGSFGRIVLVKDSQKTILVAGINKGHLGVDNKEPISTFTKINSQYFAIWKDLLQSRAKSARK